MNARRINIPLRVIQWFISCMQRICLQAVVYMPKTRQTRTWDNARLTIAPASRSVRQTIHSPRKVLLTHKQLHTFFLLRIMQSFISFMHFFRHHAIIYYPLIRRVRGNRWQSSPRSSMSMPEYTYTRVFLRLVGPIVRAQRLNHFAIKAFYSKMVKTLRPHTYDTF